MTDPAELSRAALDQRTLALWAAACAERVLVLFERACPDDDRPRRAIAAARAWARGELSIAEARARALRAHAAARSLVDAGARGAARAAGHAAATAHAPGHARHAAAYAAAAVASLLDEGNGALARFEECEWQAAQLPPHLRAVALPGPSDARPRDPRSGDAHPAEGRPGDGRRRPARSSESRPGDPRSGESRSGQTQSGAADRSLIGRREPPQGLESSATAE